MSSEGEAGEIVAQRNRFINAATSGIEFIETIGDQAPSIRAERNIFWGDNPGGAISNGDAAWSNYFCVDDVFAAEGDMRLSGNVVPFNWGAFPAGSRSFR